MNPLQQRALAMLDTRRELLARDFPNRWIAVDADALVLSAPGFDILARELGRDAGRFVFAFMAVGPWA